MLGEKIYEVHGRITTVRVLEPDNAGNPRVELSFQATGKILGVEVTELGTYRSSPQPDGTMFGEGNGILTTKKGDTIAWRGSGRGKPTGKGMGASWRGAIYYRTASAKLARLNNVPCVFEWETDEEGNAEGTIWEWK